jgi:MFS family permease
MVLAFAIVAAGLTGPGQTIGVSVFIDHLVDDLSLSRSQVSTAYLVGTLAGAMLLPSVGKFIDRRGVRVAQVLIGLLFGLALVNMSFVNGLVWLAIGFGGIRFLGQGSLSLVSTVTVQLRFHRTRGTAIGIFMTASAGLMALVPVVLAVTISAVGWRNAWLVSAAVVVGVVVPVAWFGLRDLPARVRPVATANVGATTKPSAGAIAIGGRSDIDSFERGEAMRTGSFWLLAAVSGAAGMMTTALNFHQIDLLGEAGLSEKAAAALFIPQVAGSTVAGLTIGYVGDRIGTRYLPAIGMALLLSAQLLASVAAPGAIVIIYAVVLGATGGATRTASATLQPQWFGTGHVGSIQGAVTLFGVGASAIGPVALTLTEQWLGSYPRAVVLLGVVPAAAMLFALGPNTGPTRRTT